MEYPNIDKNRMEMWKLNREIESILRQLDVSENASLGTRVELNHRLEVTRTKLWNLRKQND